MRKRFSIPLMLVVVVVVCVVGLYFWVTNSPWLKNQVESQINRALGVSTDMTFSVGRLSGDLFSTATFSGASLTIKRRDGMDTLALIDRIHLRYDTRGILSKDRRVRALEIVGLRIFLPEDSLEALFRKAGGEIAAETDIKSEQNIALDSLWVRGGTVYRQGENEPLADSIEIRGAFRSSAGRWNLAISPSNAHTRWIRSVVFEGVASSAGESWLCDSLSVRTDSSSFVVGGRPDSLKIDTAHVDVSELARALTLNFDGLLDLTGEVIPGPGLKSVSGQVRIAGTFEGFELGDTRVDFKADSLSVALESLTGVVSGARFNGRGLFVWSAKPERWAYIGRVDGFDLDRFAAGTLPTSLSGEVEINGTGVRDEDLRVRADVSLGPGRIDEIQFESATGSLGATVDSMWIGEDFAARYNGARLVGGGTMAFTDSIDMFVEFEVPDLRLFDKMVFIDSLSGQLGGYAYLSGMTKDPDIAAFINSGSLRLFDLRTAEFEARVFVPHFLSNPSGQIDARWGGASTWGIATDSISLRATLSGRIIDIDWARWYSPEVDVEGSGTLDWSADTIPLNLYPLTMRWENQTYSAADNVVLTIDSTGFTFHQFEFEGPLGIFNATGRMTFDNSMNLEFELDRFRIAKVWQQFFPTWDLDGVVAARGRLSGTFHSPAIEMAGEVSELEFEGESYGDLEGSISYRDRVLHIESAALDNRYFHAEASGAFPIDLSLDARPDTLSPRVLSTEPLTGRLEASGDNLDPINRFLPQTIESVRGNFTLKAGVTGTPQRPLFSGEASLRQGTIKAIEIINPLEDVDVDVALRHDTVVIRNASAVVRDKNQEGKVDVKGALRINSIKSFDYDLDVVGRGVPARMEFKDFYVLADFDLTVDGATPPKVTGQVRPRRVEDREPFAETEARPVYDASLWDWDIAIEMLSGGYFIKNDQLDAELSADLRLLRERGQPSYIGTAEFIRGNVYLFDKKGRITRGVLTFDDPIKNDPRLDIDVVFRIQQRRVQTRTETTSSPFIDLNLHIAGRASEPLIQPEAPYTEQDVLLLLAAGTTSFAGGDSLTVSDPLANRLKFAATGLVFSEVQRLAARKLGLETLEINSGANPFDASITIGRYFTPQLYLYGTSPVDAGAGQEVGFEYRISRRTFVDGIRDKNNLYRMNFHLNWEY